MSVVAKTLSILEAEGQPCTAAAVAEYLLQNVHWRDSVTAPSAAACQKLTDLNTIFESNPAACEVIDSACLELGRNTSFDDYTKVLTICQKVPRVLLVNVLEGLFEDMLRRANQKAETSGAFVHVPDLVLRDQNKSPNLRELAKKVVRESGEKVADTTDDSSTGTRAPQKAENNEVVTPAESKQEKAEALRAEVFAAAKELQSRHLLITYPGQSAGLSVKDFLKLQPMAKRDDARLVGIYDPKCEDEPKVYRAQQSWRRLPERPTVVLVCRRRCRRYDDASLPVVPTGRS